MHINMFENVKVDKTAMVSGREKKKILRIVFARRTLSVTMTICCNKMRSDHYLGLRKTAQSFPCSERSTDIVWTTPTSD